MKVEAATGNYFEWTAVECRNCWDGKMNLGSHSQFLRGSGKRALSGFLEEGIR